jgi:hypothetical protein
MRTAEHTNQLIQKETRRERKRVWEMERKREAEQHQRDESRERVPWGSKVEEVLGEYNKVELGQVGWLVIDERARE